MNTTQFCDRYRERNVSNPREMLALRHSKVDLSKWEAVSFGHAPPSKMKALAAQGFVIREITVQTIVRAARGYRPPRGSAADVFGVAEFQSQRIAARLFAEKNHAGTPIIPDCKLLAAVKSGSPRAIHDITGNLLSIPEVARRRA
jgi:hypothetical protein